MYDAQVVVYVARLGGFLRMGGGDVVTVAHQCLSGLVLEKAKHRFVSHLLSASLPASKRGSPIELAPQSLSWLGA